MSFLIIPNLEAEENNLECAEENNKKTDQATASPATTTTTTTTTKTTKATSSEDAEMTHNSGGDRTLTTTTTEIVQHHLLQPSMPKMTHIRALFNYVPQDDLYIPCKELGLSFSKGDILHVIGRQDGDWWQAYRDDDKDQSLAGLIPSQAFQEK